MMSVDRYLAIIYPFSYKRIVTKRRTHIIISCLWIYIMFMAFLPMMFWNKYDEVNGVCNFYDTLPSDYINWASFFTIGISIIPSLFLNIRFAAAIYHQRKSMQYQRHILTENDVKSFKEKLQSVRVTFILLMLFIFLWLPYLVVGPILHIEKKQSPTDKNKLVILEIIKVSISWSTDEKNMKRIWQW